MIKTLSALRSYFWDCHPKFAHHFRVKKRQNQYVCDVRCAWVDFVDMMQKSGEISEKLADRAIL